MCKVISAASQKGGVGKTSVIANLGIELANRGEKVLLLDMDPQGSLTASLGYSQPDDMDISMATIFDKEVNEEDYDPSTFGILHHREGVDLLPGNIELSVKEISLVNVWSRELILSKYIDKIRDRYSYILIDSMPSLGLVTLNVLAASDRIIIPVQAAYLSLKGLEQLIKTIGKVKRSLNTKLGIDGILVTMLDNRTNYSKEIVELLNENYGEYVNIYSNSIPFSVRAAEATAEGVSIFRHDPRGKVAKAYKAFAEEVLANA